MYSCIELNLQTSIHNIKLWDVYLHWLFIFRYQILVNGSLLISDIALSDQALYHCTATNPISGVTRTSSPAQLTTIGTSFVRCCALLSCSESCLFISICSCSITISYYAMTLALQLVDTSTPQTSYYMPQLKILLASLCRCPCCYS